MIRRPPRSTLFPTRRSSDLHGGLVSRICFGALRSAICTAAWERDPRSAVRPGSAASLRTARSEEHTSELQSQSNLVCRLLLEKKKKKNNYVSSIQPNMTDTA